MDLVSELWTAMAITGKVVVVVLVALSIYSYAVMVERALALRWTQERSAAFSENLDTEQGDDSVLARANDSANEGYCSLAAVVAAAQHRVNRLSRTRAV